MTIEEFEWACLYGRCLVCRAARRIHVEREEDSVTWSMVCSADKGHAQT